METPTVWQLDAVLFARGQVLVIAALFACGATGLARPLALATVVVVTLSWAGRLTLPFALALGASAWAFYTGFVTNRYGELTFEGPDLIRLALLVACAAAAHWKG